MDSPVVEEHWVYVYYNFGNYILPSVVLSRNTDRRLKQRRSTYLSFTSVTGILATMLASWVENNLGDFIAMKPTACASRQSEQKMLTL